MSIRDGLSLARYLELQQDLSTERRKTKELEKARSQIESREAELLDQLETLAIDKEVAEEKADLLGNEVEEFREVVEGLKVEVEVLKEENGEFTLGGNDPLWMRS